VSEGVGLGLTSQPCSMFPLSLTLPTSSHRSTQYSGLTVPSSQVSSSSAPNCGVKREDDA